MDGDGTIKGKWTPKEDARLKALVELHGARNWAMISAGIPGRKREHCRQRWCNHLSPDVWDGPFSKEEDDIIISAHKRYGNKWATIARLLRGRTGNAVRNQWKSRLRPGKGTASEEEEVTMEDDLDLDLDPSTVLSPTSLPAGGGGGGDGGDMRGEKEKYSRDRDFERSDQESSKKRRKS